MLLTNSLKKRIIKASKDEVSDLHDYVIEEWFNRE